MLPDHLKQIHIGRYTYNLHSFTGRVASTNKWSETHVHGGGGGGGGYVSGGTGYVSTSPVNVRSTVTTEDQLFLIDENDREKSFRLSGFDVACREKHLLTVVWLIMEGYNQGPYFLVFNHSTKEYSYRHSSLASMESVFPSSFRRRRLVNSGLIGGIAGFLASAYALGLESIDFYSSAGFVVVFALVSIFVYYLLWLSASCGFNAYRFKRSDKFKELLNYLKNVDDI